VAKEEFQDASCKSQEEIYGAETFRFPKRKYRVKGQDAGKYYNG